MNKRSYHLLCVLQAEGAHVTRVSIVQETWSSGGLWCYVEPSDSYTAAQVSILQGKKKAKKVKKIIPVL